MASLSLSRMLTGRGPANVWTLLYGTLTPPQQSRQQAPWPTPSDSSRAQCPASASAPVSAPASVSASPWCRIRRPPRRKHREFVVRDCAAAQLAGAFLHTALGRLDSAQLHCQPQQLSQISLTAPHPPLSALPPAQSDEFHEHPF